MGRPHLVNINLTDIARAPGVFYTIFAIEMSLNIFVVLAIPFLIVAVHRAGVIHPNFRWQVVLSGFYYIIAVFARFTLFYYQLSGLPLTDDDALLLAAEIARDIVIGYYCGLLCSFTIERWVATRWWKWYEKASPQTRWILVIMELANLIPATTNATLWMLGYINVAVNILVNFMLNNASCIVYYTTYKKNVLALDRINRGEISFDSYSVARTFQLRENVMVMRYFVSVALPAAAVSFPCFIYFAFHEFGPAEWILPRKIAYALFDLHLTLFRLVYLYREITTNETILREFRKINLITCIIRRMPPRRVHPYNEPSEESRTEETTQAHFDQLANSWNQ